MKIARQINPILEIDKNSISFSRGVIFSFIFYVTEFLYFFHATEWDNKLRICKISDDVQNNLLNFH